MAAPGVHPAKARRIAANITKRPRRRPICLLREINSRQKRAGASRLKGPKRPALANTARHAMSSVTE